MRYFLPLFLISLLGACSTITDPQEIVDRSIAFHGYSTYKEIILQFDFREREYHIEMENGQFVYESFFAKEGKQYQDILDNQGFVRMEEGQVVNLNDSLTSLYSNSLNSVAYFALLPEPLNDPAVAKAFDGMSTINGKQHYQVRITFKQEGGGNDFQDEFMYWFDEDNFALNYLSYRYHTNGGGVRFRHATDRIRKEGIVLNNYDNYKAPYSSELGELDSLFQAGQLEKLSRIALENVEIKTYK